MDRTSRPTKDRRNLYYARQRKKNYIRSNDDCVVCNLTCGIIIYSAYRKFHDVFHSIADYSVQTRYDRTSSLLMMATGVVLSLLIGGILLVPFAFIHGLTWFRYWGNSYDG